MQTVTLNNGVQMPILGFGVYQIPDARQCEDSVLEALRTGYRLIDTAAAYGNEEAVGRALRRSGIPREQLFVTTKLWVQDASEQGARAGVETSLRKLGLDYLDLYLIQQPYGDVFGAWRAMEAMAAEGKLRAIGVSNFAPDRVMDLIVHNKVIPAVNQIETHPFHQQLATQLFLQEQQVQIESWGPFAEGRNNLFANPALSAIAAKHRKSVAQVVLRGLTQRGVIAIPKSVGAERIAENFAVFDFRLDEEDMQAIAALDTGKSLFLDHRDPATVKALSGYRIHD